MNWKKDPRLQRMHVLSKEIKKKVLEDLQPQLQPRKPIGEAIREQLLGSVKAEKAMQDLKEHLIARKGRRKDQGDEK